jgi:hypothetical protein
LSLLPWCSAGLPVPAGQVFDFSTSAVSTSAFFSQKFTNLRFCKFGMRFAHIASADKIGEAALGKQ